MKRCRSDRRELRSSRRPGQDIKWLCVSITASDLNSNVCLLLHKPHTDIFLSTWFVWLHFLLLSRLEMKTDFPEVGIRVMKILPLWDLSRRAHVRDILASLVTRRPSLFLMLNNAAAAFDAGCLMGQNQSPESLQLLCFPSTGFVLVLNKLSISAPASLEALTKAWNSSPLATFRPRQAFTRPAGWRPPCRLSSRSGMTSIRPR